MNNPISTNRSVILRSGGLGDFVMTLPLIRTLLSQGPVTLLTRDAYFALLEGFSNQLELLSIDAAKTATLFSSPDHEWRPRFHSARVYSFLSDPHGTLKSNLLVLGIKEFHELPSRPVKPPHFMEQIFLAAGLPWEPGILKTNHLNHFRKGPGTHFWIHPGSGSPEKNCPPRKFRQIFDATSCKLPVIASFGEADLDLIPPFREAFADLNLTILKLPSLAGLANEIGRKAARFIGNDSGPAHLAAAMGIPTLAVYRTTDPQVWQPTGSCVETLGPLIP